MADQEQYDIFEQGVEAWNQWRKEHAHIRPDLIEANLSRADLRGADLRFTNLERADLSKADLSCANLESANLSGADLSGADLGNAKLSGADLSRAHLRSANLERAELSRAELWSAELWSANLSGAYLDGANLNGADLGSANLSNAHLSRANLSAAHFYYATLSNADLRDANLSEANLMGANLCDADLSGANLSRAYLAEAHLIGTQLSRANLSNANLHKANLSGANLSWSNLSEAFLTETTLTGCRIYAISAWNVLLEDTIQTGLVITPSMEPTITVDNLEIAQFIYLLLNNQKIREVIDTITSKVVLILGRFTPERKAVLDALKEALRTQGYVPILFDFDKPSSRNFTETVRTLAHLARFIIADLTDPSSIPQELQATIPTLAVPVQPVLLEGKREYAMFVDFLKTYPWVLPIHYYTDQVNLLATLKEQVIEPAEQKAQELEKR
jgi:uncharacterized protein YjbI with pentapeptide repeats